MNLEPLAAVSAGDAAAVSSLAVAFAVLVCAALAITRTRAKPPSGGGHGQQQHTKKQRRLAVIAGLAGATAFVLLFWRGPWWFDGLHIRKTQLDSADGVVITGFRTGLVALAAGLIAAVGLYYTREKHRLERDEFQHAQVLFRESQKQFETTITAAQERDERQADLAREEQVTGRYVEAIKLLTSTQIHGRLGGIYGLERIMIDSSRDRGAVLEVLAAYVRDSLKPFDDPFAHPERDSIENAAGSGADDPEVDLPAPKPLPEDIRATLEVLGRNWTPGSQLTDLRAIRPHNFDFSGANFTGVLMSKVYFGYAWLSRTSFSYAVLDNAVLRSADISRADLGHASLVQALVSRATLERTNLAYANLTNADLAQANLGRAILAKANLEDADLHEANLARADLSNARLSGALLTGSDLAFAELDGTDLVFAAGLEPTQVCRAKVYASTLLPPELAVDPQVQDCIRRCEEARTAAQRQRASEVG
ncbi:pentapeptide repeat-containing protein [Streptomyces sp. NPDC054855]